MDGFFSEQPCYRIEILEWINEEDITDEWRYIWKHDPPERFRLPTAVVENPYSHGLPRR